MTPAPGDARRARRRLLAVLFVNFIVFGGGAIVIGASVPKIVREFGWDYLTMGTVLAAGSVGYFVSTFLCGVSVRRLGPRVVIVATLVLQSAGLLLFGSTPSVGMNLLAILLIGLGEGGTEVGTNFCLVRLESSGQSRLMNLVHAAFPLGAIAASLLMACLLDHNVAWQWLFRGLALACLLVAVALWPQAFPAMHCRLEKRSSRVAIVGLVRRPMLQLLALVVLLYVGAEIGVSNWIAEYYVKARGASLSEGASMVSLIWFGLLAGRLLLSLLYQSSRQAPLLLGLTAGCTFSLGAALVMESAWLCGLLFWLSGVGFSAIYPIAIVLVGEHFPDEQELAIGVVSTAGGLGSFGFPFVMSAIASAHGVRAGFWFYAGLCALMTLTAAAILWRVSAGRPVDES